MKNKALVLPTIFTATGERFWMLLITKQDFSF